MSAEGPDDDRTPDPFQGVPLFGDLANLFAQQGGMGWDAAKQFAVMVATGGTSEPNVDPIERITLEQLGRVAELHVGQATGLVVPSGPAGAIEPVTRATWAARTLDHHRPYFELLADSLGTPDVAMDPDDPMGFMAPLLKMAGPMLLSMSAGSMVGHLAQRSFGQYDLPLPRPVGSGMLLVPANLDRFGEEWSLDRDDLRLWVCLHETTWHTVLAVPSVRGRYDALLRGWLSAFDPDGGDLGERLAGLDPSSLTDPSSLPEALADPEVLLGAMRSPAQQQLLPELEALVAVLIGYVDHVMDQVGAPLLASSGMLTEALRRQRVEAGPGDRLVEKLFGLELSTQQVERGRAFVDGVVERAGDDGLRRLFEGEQLLPTPNEVDAPGLWLARIDLDLTD